MSATGLPFDPGPEFKSRYRLDGAPVALDPGYGVSGVEIATGERVWIRFPRVPDPPRSERVMGRARAMVGLGSPNVLELLDVGTGLPAPFAVYQAAEGVDLPTLLEKHRRLAPAAALRIVRGLGQGLLDLHQRGGVHGAVALSRVSLDRAGTPRLMDVGIAPLASDASPEGEPVQDLCRLGRILFTSLAGRTPEPGESARLDLSLDQVPLELLDLVHGLTAGTILRADDLLARLDALIASPAIGGRKDVYQERTPPPSSAATPAARMRPTEPLPAAVAPIPTTGPSGLPTRGLEEPPTETRDLEPVPVVRSAPNADPEFQKRKAEAVLAATAGAQRGTPKGAPKLQIQMGEREGPGWGQLFAILLAGAAAVGLLVRVAFYERPSFQAAAPPLPTSTGFHRPLGGSALPSSDPTSEGLEGLGRAIVEEVRLGPRVQLLEALISKHPREAPATLATLLKGGNDRLRKDAFPFLERIDKDGSQRLGLMRAAIPGGGPWAVRLAGSLARAGKQKELGELAKGEEEGALAALAGSLFGLPQVPLEAATRLEASFYHPRQVQQAELLRGWISVSGDQQGPVAAWAASALLTRARNDDDRKILAEVLGALEPEARIFTAWVETLGKFAFDWEPEIRAVCVDVARHHAGEDAGRRAEFQKLISKLDL